MSVQANRLQLVSVQARVSVSTSYSQCQQKLHSQCQQKLHSQCQQKLQSASVQTRVRSAKATVNDNTSYSQCQQKSVPVQARVST